MYHLRRILGYQEIHLRRTNTNRNKHINPFPTFLNPECHVTIGWEFFENPLPEDAFLNSTAPNHM